jgi:hypothetical protein
MTKAFGESFKIVKALGCTDEYYKNGSMFWFDKDPSVIFIIRENGEIILKELWGDNSISIYELWPKFSSEQKRLIAYNLDKFV